MRLDAEDVFQASSTSRSFLESQPMENGPLRDRTDAGVLNSYFPHPSAGNRVFLYLSFSPSSFLNNGILNNLAKITDCMLDNLTR